MFKRIGMTILSMIILFLSGCGMEEKQPLRVSVNLWIGYSPLYYIERQGWLKEENIKLVKVVSLSENMDMYLSGFSDIFTGTQHEYHTVQQEVPDLTTLMLMDSSFGGDIVMANVDLETLEKSTGIDVYMEIDSINNDVFEDFIHLHHLPREKFHLINKDTYASANLPMREKPTMIITYSPYDVKLKQKGYRVIDSTKNLNIFVMDAIYGDRKTLEAYDSQIKALNRLLAKALYVLETNPELYYRTINPYFKFSDYKSFQEALDGIRWIYGDRSPELLKKIKMHGVDLSGLQEPVK